MELEGTYEGSLRASTLMSLSKLVVQDIPLRVPELGSSMQVGWVSPTANSLPGSEVTASARIVRPVASLLVRAVLAALSLLLRDAALDTDPNGWPELRCA